MSSSISIALPFSFSYLISMASSSSSVPRYDLFLSFRGEDTRHSFTDHLYESLVKSGLRIFRDNDEIDRGQELKPEIEIAIRQSRASIVVLSDNYADSRWCLDELVLILEQRRDFGHFVLPVFYHVDPSDVRNQRKSFVIDEKKRPENVNRWKAALTQVSNLTGMVLEGPETIFIAKIVDTVNFKLDRKLVSTPNYLTGIETRAEGINAWLKDKHSGADVHAICGMGGSGKTTLAQYIYNSNKQNFESSSFLQEIGKQCQEPNDLIGLLKLQKQLLRDVLGGKDVNISNVCEGTRKIEEALQIKRVLIVLDDVDEYDKLEALLGKKSFHTQSRIIITSRLLDIKAWLGSISWGCKIYTMKLLYDDESLELLCCHAFGSKIPMEGFEDLACKLARYCEGNPLALKVLGSSLFDTAQDRNSMIKIWRSTLDSLNSLQGDLNRKIQGVLQKSFYSLPNDSHKRLFLHIAIFFVGEYEDNVVNILERDCHAQAGIRTLVNRCLLTVSPVKKLMMHQLLQELGRKIIREESNDPAKRTRVWHEEESNHLLTNGDGSKTIEGLALKLREGTEPLVFKTESLVKMDKLKFLQLDNVKLTGSYKNFPKLTWLCWHGCHFKTVPSGLLSSTLVAIDMSYGSLETFEPPMVLHSLKILNLGECFRLHSIRNLNRLPNLHTLILRGCIRLQILDICKTISGLQYLAVLDLSKIYVKECSWIAVLDLPFPLPQSLEILYMEYCKTDLTHYAYDALHTQSLPYISLAGSLFEFLPRNIDLTKLVVLDLSLCVELKYLTCLPSTLKELSTWGCELLEKITFQSRRFKLQNFVYNYCCKLSEVQGLFKLVPISELDEADLGRNMQWIKKYQDHKVELTIKNISEGRICRIQMLYEYGIRSTYLKGVNYQSMMMSEFASLSESLSFRVPLCRKKRRIQGLNVTILYRSDGQDKSEELLLLQIHNKTKNIAWWYNPWVYCKPGVDEDVVWLSYWPIGNMLDPGDEVIVNMNMLDGLVSRWTGVSLVYNDTDAEIEQENNMKEEEIIGGDLSEFQAMAGVYLLSRNSDISVNDAPLLDSQGWTKYLHPNEISFSFETRSRIGPNLRVVTKLILLALLALILVTKFCYSELCLHALYASQAFLVLLRFGGFTGETEILKIKKVVSRLVGVEYFKYYTMTKQLCVSGLVHPEAILKCVREFDEMTEIVDTKACYKGSPFWFWLLIGVVNLLTGYLCLDQSYM